VEEDIMSNGDEGDMVKVKKGKRISRVEFMKVLSK